MLLIKRNCMPILIIIMDMRFAAQNVRNLYKAGSLMTVAKGMKERYH
jgi:hypothetical protein